MIQGKAQGFPVSVGMEAVSQSNPEHANPRTDMGT